MMNENMVETIEEQKPQKKLTKGDITKTYFLWCMFFEVSISFERLQSLAFCNCMMPALKKLYTTKESLCEALKRHLLFFNTEATMGSLIHGVTLAMEEQKANNDNIPDEAITNIKTGLMGPFAGLGDTIDYAILKPMIYGAAASVALTGSGMGAFIVLLFPLITYILGYFMIHMGYRLGRDSISTVLKSGAINDVILGAGILGMFMMGALAANYVSLTTAIQIPLQEGSLALQEMLDSIVPGMLPLGATFGIYAFLSKKGLKITPILLIIIAVCLLGALVGIF